MSAHHVILYTFISVIFLIILSGYLLRIYRTNQKKDRFIEKSKSRRIEIELRSEILELDRLAIILEDLERYQVPVKTIFDLNVIIEEIFVSIVNHQREDQPESRVMISLVIESEQIVVTITDYNEAFNPTVVPVIDLNAPIEEISFQGLGFQLVRHLADHIEYQRDANQNVLTIKKSYTRA